MKKILHIQLFSILSGVQRVTVDELLSLDDLAYDKWVVCKEPGALTQILNKNNIHFHYINSLVRQINPIKDLSSFFNLFNFIKRENFHIVHTHSSKTGILGRLAAYFAGVPLIIHTVHGFAFSANGNFILNKLYFYAELFLSKISTFIIVMNEKDYQICISSMGMPEYKVKLIHNGVRSQKYFPIDKNIRKSLKYTTLNNNSNNLLVGMIGRLTEQKNPQCFIEAAVILLDKYPDLDFYIVGDGLLRDFIESNLSDSPYFKKIHLIGWRSDIDKILQCIDIFVLPSNWEGLPLSIIEAMFCKLPIVVSDIPGNNDLISHNYNGLLFEKNNSYDLSIKLEMLICSAVLREKLSEKALFDAHKYYSIESHISKLIQLYQCKEGSHHQPR